MDDREMGLGRATDGVEADLLRAMPTGERRERLEACFAAMRRDGCGLTLSQEIAIMSAMECR